ncbi:hypothetical protein ABZS86_03245 [Streptomyces sp. NPDC005355]|uniref:hypothetical protein n=1 Tax=Streptomyces sp. NPDC005355 TaxID=3157038 RepID=UPI0033A3107E
MRNGFNTAGFSEVVHEIVNEPAEAYFDYCVHGRRSPHNGLSARLGPALFGTVKSSRDAVISLRDGRDHAEWCDRTVPTVVDMALTGIGSCMLTTLIGGGSTRGAIFDTARMAVDYVVPQAGADEEPAVECTFKISGASSDELFDELVRQVQSFSPNFVSIREPIPIVMRVPSGTEWADFTYSGDSKGHLPGVSSGCDLRWVSGPQSESRPRPATDVPALRVDAPKQLTGVDWGPNPQEYLLMGLAAELAGRLFELARGTELAGLPWEVTATAREDVRGFFHSDEGVAVHLQDVVCTVVPPRDGFDGLAELIERAARESVVCALLTGSHAIEVRWEPEELDNDELYTVYPSFRPAIGE